MIILQFFFENVLLNLLLYIVIVNVVRVSSSIDNKLAIKIPVIIGN
jgi:hypothetical protein